MQRELKASPFKVAASSRNQMKWEAKSTIFFIKGCRKVDKEKCSLKKYKIFRVKQNKKGRQPGKENLHLQGEESTRSH
jgi:hypothetical protein